ncbi:hypothetical protein [Salmonella phage SE20]|uniref:Uncharacterized protein n=5 Tax=Epseptimavirus TaxID=2732017 RepID=A0A9E7PGQ1_9CAUD|nr:hypothetical protein [Salmonella phage SE19]QEI25241.1 hypothetical protein [Salmonella phage SE20]URG17798.1 hypothetical protein GRN08_1340 [Salmonella phage GRNsp8]UUT40821.1 hypothetical protein [Salmonella phage GSP001]
MEKPIIPTITKYCNFESLGWAGFIDVEGIRSISPAFEEDNRLFIIISYENGEPVKLYAKTLENANDLAKHIFNHMNEFKDKWNRYQYEHHMYWLTKKRY